MLFVGVLCKENPGVFSRAGRLYSMWRRGMLSCGGVYRT